MVRHTYMKQSHSTDTTGAMGEELVPEIMLCIEFLHFDALHREQNSQTGKRRKKNGKINTLIGKRAPVGTDGDAKPLSEIRAENDRYVTTGNNASTSIQAVTQMDLSNKIQVHRIESVAERRANLNQL